MALFPTNNGQYYNFSNTVTLADQVGTYYSTTVNIGDVIIIWYRGNYNEDILTATNATRVFKNTVTADPLFIYVATGTNVSFRAQDRGMHIIKVPKG